MKNEKRSTSLYERLRAGLEEVVDFAQGKIRLQTSEIFGPPPQWTASEVARLRRKMGLSQKDFALLLNVSVKVVKGWELGERRPTRAVLRLLQVLDAKPDAVLQAVGVGQQ